MPQNIETEILTTSGRKCCLCMGIDGDYSEKKGQIAHLDKNNSNHSVSNLAWLCLDHHSAYDSTTSQHKNYRIGEVKLYRDRLVQYLKNNPINNKLTPRLHHDKPYCLYFDGINDLLWIENDEYKNLSEYTISGKFKLYDEKYTGVLLSVDSNNDDSFLYIIYYSIEHPEYPGQIQLKFSTNKKEITTLITVQLNEIKWLDFRIVLSQKKVQFEIGSMSGSSLFSFKKFNFNKIQLGGRMWTNQSANCLSSYFSNFKVFDTSTDSIISDLVFDYGDDYLNSLPKIEGMRLFNGAKIIKLL